jgi:hypothetical protein
VIALATAVAFACGLAAGLPQIARMIRHRNSEAQSPLGWAIGAKGAVATAYVGAANGAAPIVYGPSLAGATVAVVGLAVTVYFGPRPPQLPPRLRARAAVVHQPAEPPTEEGLT